MHNHFEKDNGDLKQSTSQRKIKRSDWLEAKEQDLVQRFKQVVGKAVMPNNQKCPFPKGIQSTNKMNTYD